MGQYNENRTSLSKMMFPQTTLAFEEFLLPLTLMWIIIHFFDASAGGQGAPRVT